MVFANGEDTRLGYVSLNTLYDDLLITYALSGALNVYRLLSSSFINSGKMLHPVLQKSQCWCIDGNSIFALRVNAEKYYRIELPYKTEEDKRLAEQLKLVFASILRYEKTACPFRRGFDVELPESDETVLRSSRWKNTEKARRWTLNKIWKPEDEPDYLPTYDQPMSPLTKEARTDARSRRRSAVKADDMSEELDYQDMASISLSAGSFSESKPVQQSRVSTPSLLIRRTRSVTPPHLKYTGGSIDARRRPFQDMASKRPASMYAIPSAIQNGFVEENDSTQNEFIKRLPEISEKTHPAASKKITNEVTIPGDYEDTLRGSAETQDLETVREKQAGSEQSTENIHEERLTAELASLESPPLTPPPLSDSEDSFSPTWADEIITPPDTLKLRQTTSRSHVQNIQSGCTSPTAPISTSSEAKTEPSSTCHPSTPEPASQPPPEALEKPTSATEITPSQPSTPTPIKSNASAASTINIIPADDVITSNTTIKKTDPELSPPATSTKTITSVPATPTTSTMSTTSTTMTNSPSTNAVQTDLKSILTSPQGRRLGLIQKAYIILVSPPADVFALMYEIATRLASSTLASAGSVRAWDDEDVDGDDDDDDGTEEGGAGKGTVWVRERRTRRYQSHGGFGSGSGFGSGGLPGMWIGCEDEDEDEDEEEEERKKDVELENGHDDNNNNNNNNNNKHDDDENSHGDSAARETNAYASALQSRSESSVRLRNGQFDTTAVKTTTQGTLSDID